MPSGWRRLQASQRQYYRANSSESKGPFRCKDLRDHDLDNWMGFQSPNFTSNNSYLDTPSMGVSLRYAGRRKCYRADRVASIAHHSEATVPSNRWDIFDCPWPFLDILPFTTNAFIFLIRRGARCPRCQNSGSWNSV